MGYTRLGSCLSVFDSTVFGSSLSLRHSVCLGSYMSVASGLNFSERLSMVGFTTMGSSLSTRAVARLGSIVSLFSTAQIGNNCGISCLDFMELGSQTSVRHSCMFGSMSVFSTTLCGSSQSVLNFTITASVLSLRGFSRLGSHFSGYDQLRICN